MNFRLGLAVLARIAAGVMMIAVGASGVASGTVSGGQEDFGGAKELNYPYFRTPNRIPAYAFARNDGISNAKLSPDGTHMVAAYPRSNFLRIKVAAIQAEADENHFFLDSRDDSLQGVHWLDNQHILVESRRWIFDRKRGFYPSTMLRVFQRDKNSLDMIQHFDVKRSDAAVQKMVLHMLPDDPKHILIAASPDQKNTPAVYKMNIETGEKQVVEPRRANVSVWKADAEGVVRLGYGIADDHIQVIVKKDKASAWQKLKNDKVFKTGRFHPEMFDFDGSSIIARSPAANGRFAYYRFSLETGRIVEKIFEHGDVDVGGLEVSHAKQQLLAVTYTEDKLQRHFLNDDYKKLFGLIEKALPGRSNYLLSQTADDRFLLIKSVSDRYAGAIYRLDTLTMEMEVVAEINDNLDPRLMSPTTRVNYFARDGLEVAAYLTRPVATEAKKLPAIVLPHGGPHRRDNAEYDRMAQFLASRGYLVLQPNYRGSTGYSFEYELMGYGQWGGVIQDDIEDAAKFLADEGYADPDRICIVGQDTFSSYSALLATLKTPELFACGVAISPVPDLREYVKTLRYWRGRNFIKNITGGRSGKAIKKVSPITYASDLKRPLLTFFGGRDWFVPAKQILGLDKKLKKSGAPYELLYHKNEGHGLRIPGVRSSFYGKMDEFLKEHLGRPDQSAFKLERKKKSASKGTVSSGMRRASKLTKEEMMPRCILEQFMPFVSVLKEDMDEHIGFCSSYIEQLSETDEQQERLAALLTRAKLSFIRKKYGAFAEDVSAAGLIIKSGKSDKIEVASRLALRVLEALLLERDDKTAALASAKSLSDASPDYLPGHALYARIAYQEKSWSDYGTAMQRHLRLAPDPYDYDHLATGLIHRGEYDQAKQTLATAIAMGDDLKQLSSFALQFGTIEMQQKHVEHAGTILTALKQYSEKSETDGDVPWPHQKGMSLNTYKDVLRYTLDQEVNRMLALFHFQNGNLEKGKSFITEPISDCSRMVCWALKDHLSVEAGTMKAEDLNYKLFYKRRVPFGSSRQKKWQNNLVRTLPAVPLTVMKGGKKDPVFLGEYKEDQHFVTLRFETQASVDEYTFWRALRKKADEVAAASGASSYVIRGTNLRIAAKRVMTRGRGYQRALPKNISVKLYLVDPKGATAGPALPDWVKHKVLKQG